MAKAISGHESATRLATTRYAETLILGLRETLGVSFKLLYMSILETISVIDSNPYPSSRTATQASYHLANAENTGLPNLSYDLVTIMYGFHEVPMEGRVRILNEARRLLRRGGHLAIVDICPTYTPAPSMLAGEPFVLEYQQNIESQLASLKGFRLSKRKSIVPGHVNLWLLTAA
jgi:SAM-dependent methyltransferase